MGCSHEHCGDHGHDGILTQVKEEPRDAMFLRSEIASGTYGPWKFSICYNEMGPQLLVLLKQGKETRTFSVDGAEMVKTIIAAIEEPERILDGAP